MLTGMLTGKLTPVIPPVQQILTHRRPLSLGKRQWLSRKGYRGKLKRVWELVILGSCIGLLLGQPLQCHIPSGLLYIWGRFEVGLMTVAKVL
jgi:hypothetical protein